MTLRRRIGMMAIAALAIGICGCSAPQDTSSVVINVSAASSVSKALGEINTAYAALKPWVTVVPNYGGSGTLQTQIENGAPCDVFISAVAAQMDNLEAKGLLLAGTRKNLLNNHLALVVPKDSALGLTAFTDLVEPRVKLIAIGDPGSVPAGAYARQTLQEFGIWDAVQPKLILGANVSQVLQYVDSKNVDAGVVYSTDALSDPNVKMVTVGPTDIDAAIVYPVAIVKTSKNVSAARDYIDFLSSAAAKAVFEKYGFSMSAK
jgi:molybdate transport system substrate-binding protein